MGEWERLKGEFMKRLILSVLILFSMLFAGSPIAAPAQDPQPAATVDSAKDADIRRLLDLTGTGRMAVQLRQQMAQALRPLLEQALPPGQERSQKILETFQRKFQAQITPEAFVELSVSVYDKHFTAEEIRGLIQFYESPLGKKMIAETPAIVEESTAVGRAWASQVVQKVFAEMEAEYPELKQFEEVPAKKP